MRFENLNKEILIKILLSLNIGFYCLFSFFNYDLAIRLNKKFDIINAAGVFFHLEELHSVTKGIKESLKSSQRIISASKPKSLSDLPVITFDAILASELPMHFERKGIVLEALGLTSII